MFNLEPKERKSCTLRYFQVSLVCIQILRDSLWAQRKWSSLIKKRPWHELLKTSMVFMDASLHVFEPQTNPPPPLLSPPQSCLNRSVIWAKQQLCACITLFCTFLSRPCTTTTWDDQSLGWFENGKCKAINITISFSELERGPRPLFSSFRKTSPAAKSEEKRMFSQAIQFLPNIPTFK